MRESVGDMVFANQFWKRFELALVADIYNCLFVGGVFMAMFWCVFMLMWTCWCAQGFGVRSDKVSGWGRKNSSCWYAHTHWTLWLHISVICIFFWNVHISLLKCSYLSFQMFIFLFWHSPLELKVNKLASLQANSAQKFSKSIFLLVDKQTHVGHCCVQSYASCISHSDQQYHKKTNFHCNSVHNTECASKSAVLHKLFAAILCIYI